METTGDWRLKGLRIWGLRRIATSEQSWISKTEIKEVRAPNYSKGDIAGHRLTGPQDN